MLRFDEMDRPLTKAVSQRPTAIAPGLVVAAAIALGGCSADFLRFDSPVFSLNGDKSAVVDTAEAPAGNSLYDQQSSPAPVANVARSQERSYADTSPVRPATQPSTRMARAEPIVKTPPPAASRPNYATVTTGALQAGRSITVQAGDTLYQLARRHGVSVASLRQANGLTNNVIRPGQTLQLPGTQPVANNAGRYASAPAYTPPARTPEVRRPGAAAGYSRPQAPARRAMQQPAGGSYTVRPGDSLYAISRRTGVSVADLKRLNGITNVRALRPGQKLALGASASQPRQRYADPARKPTARVASRTNADLRPTIQSKTIRTMPITRSQAPARTAPSSVAQPRILNQRPSTPIATKPEAKVARASAAKPTTKFRWPARGRVIAQFNNSGNGVKNDGINIAMPVGTAIGAADAGVVAYAGSELKGYGNLVLVRHDNGWVSAYAHASEILVKRGDRIQRGQVIAKAGRSGDVTQPQLHFELRKGAKPVDPLPHMAQL